MHKGERQGNGEKSGRKGVGRKERRDVREREVDESREEPGEEEEGEEHVARSLLLQVLEQLAALEDDVVHVVRDEHQRAHAHVVVRPRDRQQRDRDEVVDHQLAEVLRTRIHTILMHPNLNVRVFRDCTLNVEIRLLYCTLYFTVVWVLT